MEEPKIIQVGNYMDDSGKGFKNPQCGRVYSPYGIAPTLNTCGGGQREPKIMLIGSYSPSSACKAKVLDADGICPTLLDHKGKEPAIVGYTRDDKGNVQSFHKKDVAGTIHTSSGSGGNTDQFVKTPYRIRKLCPIETGRLMGLSDEDFYKMANAKIPKILKSGEIKYRPMPRTALYRMHGNSIVVDVLYHIFRCMFIPNQPEYDKPNKPIQKSLFDGL